MSLSRRSRGQRCRGRITRTNVLAAVAAAAVCTVFGTAFSQTARAATDTWTGAVSAGDPYPAGTAVWDTATANWSNGGTGVYTGTDTLNGTLGDDVVFTDNFTGNATIAVAGAAQTPNSVTFTHIPGSTPTNYVFLRNDAGGAYSSSSPFGNTSTIGLGPTLTLDTGFLGHVTLQARANGSDIGGNTVIRSGTLEINDAGAIPGLNANRNDGPVTLAGGTLTININVGGNTQPSSSQLKGTLSVTADSTLAGAADHLQDHFYNGPITVDTGATLHVDTGAGIVLGGSLAASRGAFDLGASTGVFRINIGSALATFDLGTGSATLENNQFGSTTVSLGSLSGGSGTFLLGSHQSGTGAVDTYAVGNAASSTFAGTIADGTGATPHLTALAKVGAATTLTLTGANTYTGGTTVNGGVLVVNNATGSATGTGPVTVNDGGTLGGAGSVAGLVTIAAGGTLAPGNSPGSITLTGGLSLPDGSALAVDLGAGGSDQILVTGGTLTGAATAGGITVNVTDTGGLAVGQTFTLLDFTGATLVDFDASDFTLVAPDLRGDFAIVGNTLQVTTAAVPEPAAVSILLIAAGLTVRRRRRR